MVEPEQGSTAVRDFINRRNEVRLRPVDEDYRWNNNQELPKSDLKPKDLLLTKVLDDEVDRMPEGVGDDEIAKLLM